MSIYIPIGLLDRIHAETKIRNIITSREKGKSFHLQVVKLLHHTKVSTRKFTVAGLVLCKTSYVHLIYNKIFVINLQWQISLPVKLKTIRQTVNGITSVTV